MTRDTRDTCSAAGAKCHTITICGYSDDTCDGDILTDCDMFTVKRGQQFRYDFIYLRCLREMGLMAALLSGPE